MTLYSRPVASMLGLDSASHLCGEVSVARGHSVSRRWDLDILKERDDVLLPEDAVVLLLQVDKGVGGRGMPDVWLACLDSQP